jgi:hypothetical protein
MECSVCAEKITKKRFLIECPFCEDGSICVECASKYIVSTEPGSIEPGSRGCIVCKKMWDLEYIEYMFGAGITEEFVNLNKMKLLEREKSMLIMTQPLADYERFKTTTLEQNTFLQDMRRSLLDRIKEVESEMHINISKIRTAKPADIGKNDYILACPSPIEEISGGHAAPGHPWPGGQGCKGFINSKTWSCSLCGIKVCEKCHQIINNVSETTSAPRPKSKPGTPGPHRCKPDDVASVKIIMNDTKPCPTCATRIHKLEGCVQMFCTNCMTAFDWKTLKIITGVIHNPHYYDFVRRGLIDDHARAVGDIPCGGMPDFFSLRITLYKIDTPIYMTLSSYHQLAMEIQDYLMDLPGLKSSADLFTDLRVKYMLNKIPGSDEDYAKEIYNLHIYIQRCKIEKESLETLLAVFSERFRSVADMAKDIMSQRKIKYPPLGPRGQMIGKPKSVLIPMKERRNNLHKYLEGLMAEFKTTIEMINETFIEHQTFYPTSITGGGGLGIHLIDIPAPDVRNGNRGHRDIHYSGFRVAEINDMHHNHHVMHHLPGGVYYDSDDSDNSDVELE